MYERVKEGMRRTPSNIIAPTTTQRAHNNQSEAGFIRTRVHYIYFSILWNLLFFSFQCGARKDLIEYAMDFSFFFKLFCISLRFCGACFHIPYLMLSLFLMILRRRRLLYRVRKLYSYILNNNAS